jgi:hypothetical protein
LSRADIHRALAVDEMDGPEMKSPDLRININVRVFPCRMAQ